MHEHRVEIGRAAGDVAARARDLLGDKFVERAVLRDLLADPFVVDVRGFHVGAGGRVATAFDAQHLGPEIRPHVGEALAQQKAVNQGVAFARRWVGHERTILRGGRLGTGEIEEDPSQEGLIVAQIRGQQAQFLEPIVNDFVDVVVGGRMRPRVVFARGQHDHFRADRETVEASKHVGVATAGRRDDAVFIHLGSGRVVGGEERKVGHIARRSIRVTGGNRGFLRARTVREHDAIRRKRQADRLGHGRGVVGRAPRDPSEERAVVGGVLREQFAAGVRDFAGGLEHEQTLLGRGEIEAAADELLREPVVVPLGIVAEERQHESILTARGTVTRAGVASRTEKHRHDIAAEARHLLGAEQRGEQQDEEAAFQIGQCNGGQWNGGKAVTPLPRFD